MSRTRSCFLAALVLAALVPAAARADGKIKANLKAAALDFRLCGKIIDRTHNHGCDNRIWSRSLFEWRDLYIYLPPGYDPKQCYPVMIYLHGFGMDETSFLSIIAPLDEAMSRGKLPPMIIAAPDGSIEGKACHDKPGSFFINSNAGNYEDFILQDVWDHLIHNYSIRTEREAHVLAGISMGGFGAFNLGIRHRDAFGVVVGIFPPLNLRWQDGEGNPKGNFHPRSWGWRSSFDNPREIIGRLGANAIRLHKLIRPVFGEGEDAVFAISQNNPIELVDRTKLHNGDLQMYIAYAGKDEYNIDAQVESFLYLCKHRGLYVGVAYDPDGRHDAATARRFVGPICDWLCPRLTPYAPGKLVEERPAMLP